jgi:hypothetical protein
MLGVSDCIRDSIGIAIPQPTEWQHIGNEIDAAFIFARTNFVNVHRKPRAVSYACLDHSSFIGSRYNLGGLAVCCS